MTTPPFSCDAEQFRSSNGPAEVPLRICCVATLIRRPTDPAQADPAQADPAQAGPAQAGPAQADPAQAGPAPTAFPCLADLLAAAVITGLSAAVSEATSEPLLGAAGAGQ